MPYSSVLFMPEPSARNGAERESKTDARSGIHFYTGADKAAVILRSDGFSVYGEQGVGRPFGKADAQLHRLSAAAPGKVSPSRKIAVNTVCDSGGGTVSELIRCHEPVLVGV